MTDLYKKYCTFLEDQISYQRHVQEKTTQQGNSKGALEAKHRELMYREMMEDHRKASMNSKGPMPKQFENFTGPPHREIIHAYLNNGSRTINQIIHHAKETGQNQSSIRQMVMQMVRRGELSRCGDMISVPGGSDDHHRT